MLELVLIAVFLSVMLLVLTVGLAMNSRRQQALRRAVRATRERNPKAFPSSGDKFTGLVQSVFKQFTFLFPDSADLRIKLVRAGYSGRSAPLTYSSLRVMLLVGLPVLGFLVGMAVSSSLQTASTWAAGGIVLSIFAPPYVLARRVSQRAQRIRKHLPDGLDLMVVCVEAGLGLDAAILKVSDELTTSHPDIAQEFRVVTQLVNAGVPRIEALREIAHRTGVQEVNTFVSTLIQSERLGTPIGRTLRLYSEQMRTKRRQTAEEAAAKAPIKMLIPMVLFILPALFIVVVGPAIIILTRVFSGVVE
ncbi:MAG: type II secretion system F family protein [Gemmatimonadota bacterium]|nr:MAG: type II secretion system F family protein [Gemmatimonadota bacterium]